MRCNNCTAVLQWPAAMQQLTTTTILRSAKCQMTTHEDQCGSHRILQCALPLAALLACADGRTEADGIGHEAALRQTAE
eukprot:CAMPEP_0204592476 /NCGR_PEP_ID=MMETSP0661-20131031/50963_1 /ASSEMBLY_ACC=CAM_ASM_000606 /TAXON_ID=109239 /ORGANISM="Alexandrium margalefi, Strain AMGDE01CS-322" /LENGTH=78 /DNA_ID=CAMNT_0051602707 /DNA_START=84 /DNA_END=317 /DNA_ORIENTATION=+